MNKPHPTDTQVIGYNYTPRTAFVPYHHRITRYAVLLCHRRSGKSYATLNDMIVRGMTLREDGLRMQFALLAPTQTQARSIAWQYLRDQTRCFSTCKGYKALEQHLSVTLPDPKDTNKPGTTIMLLGAENAERIRGLFLDGCVVDEAADISDFIISSIIRPALADRQGWLTIAGTVKSIDDYLWRTYELAQKMPLLWFNMNLKASESGILPQHELEDLKRSMSHEAYAVEFENDVQAAVTGKILLPYMNQLQVTRVPFDPAGGPVVTAWDLGVADAMAVWTFQMCGREPHILDYKEEAGKDLAYFVTWLSKLPYALRFGAHLLPHDAKVRELGSGRSRVETLRSLGLTRIKVVQRLSKDEQIEAGRQLLPMVWFDEKGTEEGRRALRNYTFAFDPKKKVFSKSPQHDQYSNGSDAFLTLAVGLRRAMSATDGMTGEEDGESSIMGLGQDNRPVQEPYVMDPGI